MITTITATGMKGLDFSQPVALRTLLTGPNGAGKSARLQALMLAVKGYVPGGAKTNEAILETYGTTGSIRVGFEFEGLLLEREFCRKGDSVSQAFRISGAKVGKELFAQALGKCDIRLLDLSAFMGLSDAKKIDMVLSLYPPAGNVSQILTEIEQTKAQISTQNAKHKSAEEVAARLTAQYASMEKPAGTAAENDAEIAKVDAEIEAVRKEIKEIEIAAAEKAAAEKATAEAEKKAAAAAKQKEDDEKLKKQTDALIDWANNPPPITPAPIRAVRSDTPGKDVILSIKGIIAIMEAAGCDSCAAKMVAARELKRYQIGGTHV